MLDFNDVVLKYNIINKKNIDEYKSKALIAVRKC